MKKLLSLVAAIFIASVSFAQVSLTQLDYSQKDSTWTKDVVSLWNNYSGVNPYAKVIKFSTLKAEDIVAIYQIIGITKSRKMIKDTAGVAIAEHPEQWMISYKSNGKIVAFVTYDDPTNGGAAIAAKSVVSLMAAGIHQGDDAKTNAYSISDEKFAAKEESNVKIPKTPNGF